MYQYDGEGRRVQQSVGATVTKFLPDLQPGLSVTLSETTGAAVTQYVHAPRGILAQKDSSGSWDWMMQDGLGSVRAVADSTGGVLWNGSTAPYGDYFGEVGTRQSNYGFTGEYTDPVTGQVHLRARDYNPALGVFGSLDPLEMTNQYAYVSGNPVSWIDLTGTLPTDYGIQQDKYRYSLRCGWLDIGHMAWQGARYHEQIAGALQYEVNSASVSGASRRGRVIRVETPTDLFVVNYWAYVPENLLADFSTRENIALGIFKEFHEIYEGQQSSINLVTSRMDAIGDVFFDTRASGFSEEDLPSNLIGYYLHKNHGWRWQETYLVSGSGNTDTYTPLHDMCHIMTRDDTAKVYSFYTDYYYNHHWFIAPNMPTGLFILNWRNWYRRPSQITGYWSEVFPNTPQPHSEQWPVEFSNLSAGAIAKRGTLPIDTFKNTLNLPTDGWYQITGAGTDSVGLSGVSGVSTVETIREKTGFTPFDGPIDSDDFVLRNLFKIREQC